MIRAHIHRPDPRGPDSKDLSFGRAGFCGTLYCRLENHNPRPVEPGMRRRMNMTEKFIVGIGGTTRGGSSTELLVRAVLDACARQGAKVEMFGAKELVALPFYAPENEERSDAQRHFIDSVRRADGLVIGSPGYHAGISALVKNAIDLMQDTMTDKRVYLDGCPVGLVVSAAGWQATGTTLSSLRDIVCSLRGWPTPVGVTMNSLQQKPFDADGKLIDDALSTMIESQAKQLMGFGYA